MVYIESTSTVIPDDLMDRLEKLTDSITGLKNAEKEIKEKISIKRGELDMIVDKYGIGVVETESSTVSINTSERFSKWDDVDKVFTLIPRRLQTADTMTPDVKKIRAMVGKGKIPEEIMEHAVMSEVKRMSFKTNTDE